MNTLVTVQKIWLNEDSYPKIVLQDPETGKKLVASINKEYLNPESKFGSMLALAKIEQTIITVDIEVKQHGAFTNTWVNPKKSSEVDYEALAAKARESQDKK